MINAQVQFLGINANIDSGKIPQSQYRYLLNGRVDSGSVAPTRRHLKIDTPPGDKSNIFVLGDYIVLVTSSDSYYKRVTDSTWSTYSLSLTGKVRFQIVPDNYSTERITYNDDASNVKILPSNITPIPASLMVTNGTTHYRVLNDLSFEAINSNYNNWTTTNPEYVPSPIDKIVVSGSKMYCTYENKIYHSVSGRFYDFVINRTPTGDKGGNEQTTYKSVGTDTIRALFPLPDGGVLVCSGNYTHALTPINDLRIFGEPMLTSSLLFPVGAVNEYSIVDVLGDLFIVTHDGIISFNYVSSTKQSSQRSMVSNDITPLIKTPITRTATTIYKHYALFALDTIFGPAIVVYDTILRAFVSIDPVPYAIKQFYRSKVNDKEYLFFVDENNDFYQAYASNEFTVPEIYIGDLSPVHSGDYHTLDEVRVFFSRPVNKCQVSIVTNGERTKVWSGSNSDKFSFLTHNDIAIKTGIIVEWSGDSELISVMTSWSPSNIVTATRMEVHQDQKVRVATDSHITLDEQYNNQTVVLGRDKIYVANNEMLVDGGVLENFTGKVYDVTTLGRVTLAGVPVLHVGDISNSGDVDEIKAGLAVLGSNAYVVPGNHDLDQDVPDIYPTALKYHYIDIYNIRFLMLNSGVKTNGTVVVDLSAQQSWINQVLASVPNSMFVVALVHRPPYSYDNLHYNEHPWVPVHNRIDLHLHGHTHLYQRLAPNRLILGPSGGGERQPIPNIPVPYVEGQGFLEIVSDNFKLIASWYDQYGNKRDEIVVRSRLS